MGIENDTLQMEMGEFLRYMCLIFCENKNKFLTLRLVKRKIDFCLWLNNIQQGHIEIKSVSVIL